MTFYYVFSGWEGSAANSTMFHDARITDLPIPAGKYYLADAGFPTTASLIIPFCRKCYHLMEWGCANILYIRSYPAMTTTNAITP